MRETSIKGFSFIAGDPDSGIPGARMEFDTGFLEFFDGDHREQVRQLFTGAYNESWDECCDVWFDDECATCKQTDGHKRDCPDQQD